MTETSKPLEWDDLWAEMEKPGYPWVLTTESMYDEMLNVLPPRAYGGDGFLVGEPLTHNNEGEAVHAGFFRLIDGNYYAKNMTVREFQLRMGIHK